MKKASRQIKSPKRILHIGMHDELGGVETFIFNYYKNIDKTKIQFDFINPYKKICYSKDIMRLGGIIYDVPNFRTRPIGYYHEIKKIVKKNKYDIVHIHLLSLANILPILAAKAGGAKSILLHAHCASVPKSLLKKKLDNNNKKIITKLSTNYLACSNVAGEWMFGRKKFRILHNAIDLKAFAFKTRTRNTIRKQLGYAPDNLVLGNVGRIVEGKNHDFLIDIFQKVYKANKKAKLLIIGDGKLRPNLENKIKQSGLTNAITLLGERRDIDILLQGIDIFVNPSESEGLSIATIEAQASGLPCVLSGQIPEEVKILNSTSFMRVNSNAQAWSNKILSIKHANRALANKTMTTSNYNILTKASELERYYLSLCD